MQFSIECFLNEIDVFAQNAHMLTLDCVLFTVVYAAPKIVLNKYLWSDYFPN